MSRPLPLSSQSRAQAHDLDLPVARPYRLTRAVEWRRLGACISRFDDLRCRRLGLIRSPHCRSPANRRKRVGRDTSSWDLGWLPRDKLRVLSKHIPCTLTRILSGATTFDSMTDTRPHDIAPASSAPDSESRKRRRTYKACFACRSRKGKCELNASGVPPCLRCRRELRECVFPEHRAAAPRMASSGNAPHRDSEGAGADVPRREQSMVAPYGDTPAPVPASDHDQALLQSVVRTVVSSGNDALNVLFQAALEQRDRNQASTGKASRTQAPNTSPHDRQPALPATTSVPQYKLNVWRRSRLVRAGWLTAEEAVMYVDR